MLSAACITNGRFGAFSEDERSDTWAKDKTAVVKVENGECWKHITKEQQENGDKKISILVTRTAAYKLLHLAKALVDL